MHRMTKFTAIPAKVKSAVAARDCVNGPATCILCGAPGKPNAHIIRRSQGGMGVEQNIISLCCRCHYAFDEGLSIGELAPLGFTSRSEIKEYIINYIKGFYPDWTPESVTYQKWRQQYAEQNHYYGPLIP